MKTLNIRIDDNGASIEALIADDSISAPRRALLIIPGGGYIGLATDREGWPIADEFMKHGFNTFILNYYVGREQPFPIQLIQAARAIKHIKDHSGEYGILPEEIFAVGFSAGGHLAASLATLLNDPKVTEELGVAAKYVRPRGVILGYPVISARYHKSSFKNLLASNEPSDELLNETSIELHVDGTSSPAFILHTSDDEIVDVRNSLVLGEAYRAAGVRFEMHIFPSAPHGIALATEATSCGKPEWDNKRIAEWVRLAAEWANEVIQK